MCIRDSRYTDWNGERKQTQKRGFKTKREAQAWEREQLNKTSADLDMTFKSFVDLYTADMKTRLMRRLQTSYPDQFPGRLLARFSIVANSALRAPPPPIPPRRAPPWQHNRRNA